jgi:hypothetical protein
MHLRGKGAQVTDQQQRIAIAEACGYKDVTTRITEGTFKVITGFKNHNFDEEIPDYLNDLNAMHEAEKVLTTERRRSYVNCIFNLPVSDCESNTFATAAQRAKAFLRAIGKWEVSHD